MAVSDAIINIATRGEGRVSEALARVALQAEALEKRFNSANNSVQQFNKATDDGTTKTSKLSKAFNRLDKIGKKVNQTLLKVGKALLSFFKTFAKFSFIGLAAEIAVFTTALASVNLLLATGSLIAKGYQAALRGVSTAAAGVVIGLSTAAAAVRQFQQAQLVPFLGGGAAGYRSAQQATRLSSTNAGLLGGEGASNVVTSLVKGGVAPANINRVTSTLLNLSGGNTEATVGLAGALASGDFEKSIEAVRGASGFRKDSLKGVTTMQGLMQALAGGGVVSDAFAGSASMQANTLIGAAKAQFAEIKQIFADLGGPFLEPFKQSLMRISNIFKEAMLSISTVLKTTGVESFIPTLERFIKAIVEFFRSNIVENVADLNKTADSFVNFFAKTKEFFLDIRDVLRELSPASTVVIDMFRAVREAAGGRGLFRGFADMVVQNADKFKEFGTAVGNVFGAIFDLFKAGNTGFFGKLDVISKILNVVAQKVIPALGQLLGMFMPLFERLPQYIENIVDIIMKFAPALETGVEIVVDMLDGAFAILNFVAPILSTLASAITSFVNVIPGFSKVLGMLAIALGVKSLIGASGLSQIGTKGLDWLTDPKGGAGRDFLMRNGSRMLRGAAGAGLLGYGIYEALGPQTGGGLVGGLSAAGGTALLGNALGLKGPALAQATGIVGGATAMYGGTMSAYESGRFGLGNTLSGIGGGAAMGASLASIGGPLGMAAGALVGAIVGGVATGLGAWFGQIGNNRGSDKFAGAIDDYLTDLESATYDTAEGFYERYNFKTALQTAMTAGEDTPEFEAFINQYKDMFNEMFDLDIDSLDQERLRQLIQEGGYLERASELMIDSAQKYVDSTEMIAAATGLVGEDIRRFAESLGIDLFRGIAVSQTAMTALVSTMNNIDLNRGVIADVSTLPFNREDTRASVESAFKTLIGGAEGEGLNAQNLSQYLSTASQYEVAYGGGTPMTAAVSAIENLITSPLSPGLTEDERARANEISAIARSQILPQQFREMSAATNGFITEDQLLNAFETQTYLDARTGRTFTTDTGSAAVQKMLQNQDVFESAFDLAGNMDSAERMRILENAGVSKGGLQTAVALADRVGMTENEAINQYLLSTDRGLNENVYYAKRAAELLEEVRNAIGVTTLVEINGISVDLDERIEIDEPVEVQIQLTPQQIQQIAANPTSVQPIEVYGTQTND